MSTLRGKSQGSYPKSLSSLVNLMSSVTVTKYTTGLVYCGNVANSVDKTYQYKNKSFGINLVYGTWSNFLEMLFLGACGCLRVPHFCTDLIARTLAEAIINDISRQNYYHELKREDGMVEYIDYNVDRVGPVRNTLFNPEASYADFQKYHDNGYALMNYLRSTVEKYGQYPIDQLMVLLNESWPNGAQLDEVTPGVEAYAGVGRITRNGKTSRLSEEPHKDSLPGNLAFPVQIGANIFLAMPRNGGELVIWDEANGSPLRKVCSVHPELGDLVLVRTDHFHSIEGFSAGDRVTISCFIGMDYGKPLKVWS